MLDTPVAKVPALPNVYSMSVATLDVPDVPGANAIGPGSVATPEPRVIPTNMSSVVDDDGGKPPIPLNVTAPVDASMDMEPERRLVWPK